MSAFWDCRWCGLRMPLGKPCACPEPVRVGGDPRAQLWTRVYATEFHAARNAASPLNAPGARRVARREAVKAVADFDEHYLGGKR